MKRKFLVGLLVFILAVVSGCGIATDNGDVSDLSTSSSVKASRENGKSSNGSSFETSKEETNSSENAGTSNNGNGNQASKNSTTQNSQNSQTTNSTESNSKPSSSSAQGGGTSATPSTPTDGKYTLKNAEISGTTVNASPALFTAEGYGKNATGGGNLSESSSDYYKVSTAEEFLAAIGRKNYSDKNDSGFPTRPAVVEVTQDLDLGWNNLSSTAQGYSDVVKGNDASVHPTLKQTGVSTVYITARENLTIFSKNGATIKHACFQIRGYDNQASKNIVIRNLRFEGPWEWDDSGKYDANDWDIFTIRADKGEVSNILIDHCTFTKPYDGTIDIKYGATDITISWCAFLPHDKNDAEFMAMMNHLESNRSSFANYNAARSAGATFEDMIDYAMINKKVHLIGHTDNNPGDENIRVTYCNNYYYNCTERIPRLRLGKAHVYNCIIDASPANDLENSIKSRFSGWPTALTFASNGSLGTNYGQLLLENCYINGVNTPLRNNNKKAGLEYTGCCDALYSYYTVENIDRSCKYGDFTVTYSGRYTFLGHSTKNDGNLMSPFPINPLAFDTDKFKSELGYEYTLYDPEQLDKVQNGNVGADTMSFNVSQWLKTTYSSSENISNTIKINGLKGSTANLGASRK